MRTSVSRITRRLVGVSLLVLLGYRGNAVQISIGEKSIQLPTPTGFSDVTEASREKFDLFSDMLPDTNQLHAAFVSEGDSGLLLKAEEAELDQYILVQSVKAFDELTLSKSQFGELRAILRNEYVTAPTEPGNRTSEGVPDSSRALSGGIGTEVKFKANGVATLGIDEESASYIMLSFLVKSGKRAGEESTEGVVAGTMITVLINGKVLQANVYRTYQSDEDIEWTRSQARDWLPSILAANESLWPLADGRIVPQGTLLADDIEELIIGDQTEFRTLGHPKSDGVDVGMRYPASWTAKEGIRPHIVQKFSGPASGGTAPFCAIIVQDTPPWASYLLQGDTGVEVLSETLGETAPAGSILIDGGQTRLDAEPAFWFKYRYAEARAGSEVMLYCLQYVLFYDGKMLAVQCSVGGEANDRELLEEAFCRYLPLFQSIGNSIVLYSKWSDPESRASSSFMEATFGKFWLFTLLVSASLTWGIGLLPPVITRFAIARHPLNKQGALVFVASF